MSKNDASLSQEDRVLDKTEGGVLMSSQHHRHSLVLLSLDNSTVSRISQSERGIQLTNHKPVFHDICPGWALLLRGEQ